jgi:hypothetical protein
MADLIEDISQVPMDIDPIDIGTITNPLKETFVCMYNGKKRITLAPGESKSFPLNICVHVAKHLADRIVYTNREKEILKLASKEVQSADGKYVRMIDDKILFEERKKAIPNYRERLWEEMKKVITTDSTFFYSENAEGKATGYTKRGETIDESTIEDL